MKRGYLTIGVLAAMLVPATSQALPSVAVAGDASTLGLGGEAVMEIIPWVNVRVLAHGFAFSDKLDKDGIEYDGNVRLFSGGALLDVHPLIWGPRVSVGIMGNGNRINLHAQCQNSNGCTIQDVNISNPQGAQVDGAIKFNKAAPYAGLGWGNAMLGIPLYIGVDAGVLFQGKPKVNLAASGTATVTDPKALVVKPNDNLATDPQVQAAVAEEQGVLANDVKNLRFYPVLSLTLGWRF